MFPNLTKCTMKLWKDNDELDWTWPPRRQYPDPILPFHLCKMHNCNITSRFIFILSEDWYGCQVKGNGCLLWLLVDFFSGWQLKSWLWFWQQTHSFCKCWKGNVWTGNPEREGVVSGAWWVLLFMEYFLSQNYWKQHRNNDEWSHYCKALVQNPKSKNTDTTPIKF